MYAGRKQVGLRGDRAKALVGVIAVHAFLGLALITGLAMRTAEHDEEALKTFDVTPEIPPPPLEPSADEPRKAAEAAAPPAPKADPIPVEAPKPLIPLPTRPAAPVAGEGRQTASGASTAGTGPGSGGSGSGTGGGGGGGAPTPAQHISGGIGDSDYRRIAGGRTPVGQAAFVLKIGPAGRAENCRIGRSSGVPDVDSNICGLLVRRLRFRPARDGQGRAIAQDVTFSADWGLR